MLVWFTEIPIQCNVRCSDAISLMQNWIAGSPNNSWALDTFTPQTHGEVVKTEHDGHTTQIIEFKHEGSRWVAMRYIKSDPDGRTWTTEVVFHWSEKTALASIQLHCVLGKAGPVKGNPRKPYIVRQILDQLGGGLDGGIPISSQEYKLRESDVDIAKRIVIGETRNHLPIVYVSAKYHGGYAIEPDILAKDVSGMAHVVVEPSRHFSRALARSVDKRNVYGGALGIFWPAQGIDPALLFPSKLKGKKGLVREVEESVRRSLLNATPSRNCTWSFLQSVLLKERNSRLRQEVLRTKSVSKSELQSYISSFDAEQVAREQEVEEKEREIARLRAELRAAEAKARVRQFGFLKPGAEAPFYEAEISDAIIATLDKGRSQLFGGGRRQHLIDDLLCANQISSEGEELEGQIKRILHGCKNLGKKERRQLEDVGFEIHEDGKHIEIIFRDDQRYSFTMPKTGSDHRGMKNFISDVRKKLFL